MKYFSIEVIENNEIIGYLNDEEFYLNNLMALNKLNYYVSLIKRLNDAGINKIKNNLNKEKNSEIIYKLDITNKLVSFPKFTIIEKQNAINKKIYQYKIKERDNKLYYVFPRCSKEYVIHNNKVNIDLFHKDIITFNEFKRLYKLIRLNLTKYNEVLLLNNNIVLIIKDN